MTALHKHIIQKQSIEITFSSGTNATALQDKIKNIYYEKVVPSLDDLFSGLIKDDTVIRLDKLDIDAGIINDDDLERQLVEKIIAAVKQQLKSSLRFDVKDSNNVQLLPGGQSVIDAFLYFLRQGYFPWWSSTNDLSVLESAIIQQYKVDKNLPAKIIQLINVDANATARLNFQFSKQFRVFIVEKIFASHDKMQQNFLRELFLQHDEFSTIKNNIRNYVDENQISEKNFEDDDAIKNEHHKENNHQQSEKKFDKDDQILFQSSTIKNDEPQDINGPGKFNDEHTTSTTIPLNLNYENTEVAGEQSNKQDDIKKDQPSSFKEKKEVQQTNKFSAKEITGAQSTNLKNKNSITNEADFLINQKQTKQETLHADKTYHQKIKKEFDKETIYLDLAGLVILHPFIIELFTSLKLTNNNQFISEALMHKAVHLLGYIATGKTEIEEQLLILPKLLCGMELTEAVEKEIIITDEERHEVTELLNTVIAYWKAIGNTSPEGLRGSFLLRAGKLSPREGGWQLDVEQKTWDILLGKLPWGISIIKLPWMQEILFVNWQ